MNGVHSFSGRVTMKRAFTLIEVLVVVAIIALLVAILIPSLARAREQARIASCMANMSNMPKAAIMFSQAHKGFGQILADVNEIPPNGGSPSADPGFSKYAYQSNAYNRTGMFLKAWPVAYAKELGYPTIKRMEDYFDTTFNNDPSYYLGKFSKLDVLRCPSDRRMVDSPYFPFPVGSGYAEIFGILSYAVNEDVFGFTRGPNWPGLANEGQPWKDGQSGDATPARCRRLEGRLEHILRPSEVVLFIDGGNEEARDRAQTLGYPPLVLTNESSGNIRGPYVENFEAVWGRLPHLRHSNQGGLAAACADGSAKYMKPIQWTTINNQSYVLRYAPRLRISPYNVGQLQQPQP